MNFKLLRLFLFAFCLPLFQTANAQCDYTLELFDSFGDGWGDGTLTVTSGSAVYTFSLNDVDDDGIDTTITFVVEDNAPLSLSWSPGFDDFEVSFTLYDYDGNLIFDMFFPFQGVLFTDTGVCPDCLKAKNVRTENVYDTYAKLRWQPGGTDPVLGWWVIYGLEGFSLASGVGDSVFVNTPKATITGLSKKTGYDFYVIQQCDSTTYGTTVGPVSFQTYWSDDVGIAQVLTPGSGCDLGTETVTIVMQNYGSHPQSLIPFRFRVNGFDAGVPQPQDGFYTGVLGKDSMEVIEFETTYDFSEPGEYLIEVFTQMTGDEDTRNDTFKYYLVNRLMAPYFQDFETWNGAWHVDTENSVMPSWEFGQPAGSFISAAASGKNAWVTNLEGNYNASEVSYLESPCFDFSDLTEDPVIEFSLIHSTEFSFDGAYLEMTINDGQSWEKVGTVGEGFNWYNFFNTILALGDVWAGDSDGWQKSRIQLLGASGNSSVRLRFAFESDFIINYEGIGIDDIRISVPVDNDLVGLSAISAGEDVNCGLEDDEMSFTFTNFGKEPQSFFEVGYSVNGGAPVIETVATVLQPNESFTYTFNTPFSSKDGVFNIKCWTSLLDEQNLANDTAYYTVSHLPRPVPVYEDFEDIVIPDGWTVTGFPFITNGNANTSFVIETNLWSSNPSFVYDMPRYGQISANDSLTFDYRITDFGSGGTIPTSLAGGTKIDVLVSTDCETYQAIYSINIVTHTPSVNMKKIKLSLAQFAGQNIAIRFRGTWTAGDFYFDLDNINLRACAPDMELTASVVPSTNGQNGEATVNVGLGNPPYKYAWSNGATTQTVTNLPVGPIIVTVTDALGCTDVLTVNVGTTSAPELEGLTALSLRPNPTTGFAELNVAFDRAVDMQVELLNLVGQRIWESNTSQTHNLNETLDLSGYPDGLYLVRLTVNGRVLTKKLVKSN